MKVQINNLGPIEQAEVEVRPLTVFVGPNNSGKTLTSYVLAAIFGPFGFTQYYKNISQD